MDLEASIVEGYAKGVSYATGQERKNYCQCFFSQPTLLILLVNLCGAMLQEQLWGLVQQSGRLLVYSCENMVLMVEQPLTSLHLLLPLLNDKFCRRPLI